MHKKFVIRVLIVAVITVLLLLAFAPDGNARQEPDGFWVTPTYPPLPTMAPLPTESGEARQELIPRIYFPFVERAYTDLPG